jgi:hypothetical protein
MQCNADLQEWGIAQSAKDSVFETRHDFTPAK